MVFSSISFLFFFLPLLLLTYYLVPFKYRNYVLLAFSLLFYFLGEGLLVLLLLGTCLVNYVLGLLIEKRGKAFFIIGICFNIGLLVYFKYTNFFLDIVSDIIKVKMPFLKIVFPLGISFFTFQNLSYLIDVYKNDVKPTSNIFKYATYITLFPQLIAGPIVRYKEVASLLDDRKTDLKSFSDGVTLFIVGLAKKVLLADAIYRMYTDVLESNMSFLSYVLVACGFTLQIYYDFSGYSDMAIGLGKMFGFNFPKNFDYPLWASSITDFWKRWHITLSSFFRDYVYIPLGGKYCSIIKIIFNIFVVWLLTGLWHGAAWNFVLWGLYFFVFLILEKYFLKKYLNKGFLAHLYTFIVILFSFVIFSINDLEELGVFLKGMLGIGTVLINKESLFYLSNNFVLIFICILGISPFLKNALKKLKKGKLDKIIEIGEIIYIFAIFILVIASIISNSFSPFIYFRF